MTKHNEHIAFIANEIFAPLGFTEVAPGTIMNFDGLGPLPEGDTPTTFYHAGIDAYFAYAPEIVDGMYDGQLEALGAIAIVDDDWSGANFDEFRDVPLEVIKMKELPEFLVHRAFNPRYFDLRIAKLCVAYAQQELNDLGGDSRPTREQFRQCRKKCKEAVKHLSQLVVPRYQPAF